MSAAMRREVRCEKGRALMYIRLSTEMPRSSGNCCLHFSKKLAISSPFLHWAEGKGGHQRGKGRRRDGQSAHRDHPAMTCSVPVRVGDLDVLLLEKFLVPDPLAPQLLALCAFALLPLTVGQERGVDRRVLGELALLGRWTWIRQTGRQIRRADMSEGQRGRELAFFCILLAGRAGQLDLLLILSERELGLVLLLSLLLLDVLCSVNASSARRDVMTVGTRTDQQWPKHEQRAEQVAHLTP